MEKKKWTVPEVLELGVENTEYGNEITPNVDYTYTDGKHTFWSFS